jgi:hypothetical protein
MHLNLKTILLPLVIFLAGLLILTSFPGIVGSQQGSLTPTPAEDDLAKAAAIQGATVFFTIDEQAGKDAWIESFCMVSTESGCAFYKLGLSKLWKQFETAHTSITPTILSSENVTTFPEKQCQQVWKLEIELSKPLPGRSSSKDTAYTLVVLEQGTWKFDRFLTPDEVNGLPR